jgi:hypothetical protein
MAKEKYTIMHIPSGYLWHSSLIFDKKSKAIGFLNSLPTKDGRLDFSETHGLDSFRGIKAKKLDMARKLRLIEIRKIEGLLSMAVYTNSKDPRNVYRDLINSRRAVNEMLLVELAVVPIKESHLEMLNNIVKPEEDE